MITMHIGLCEGRHTIKTNEGKDLDDFIFSQVDYPMDFISHFHTAKDYFSDNNAHTWKDGLYLYITGLTPLLTATLLAAEKQGMEKLILMHYDRESGKYVPQDVSSLL